MTRILLSPVTAVTCNDAFEIIDDAAIHIENTRISYVGPREKAPDFAPDETIGGAHLVAMPGLVNTHTHAAMTLLRGYADDMTLEAWLQQKIWPFESHLTGEDVYDGTRLAICEMLRSGTTCFADMYHFYEDGARAMIESGTRAMPGGVLLGILPNAPTRIANALAFAHEYSGAGEGRITPALAPHSLYTCDRDHWRAMIEGAHKLGVMIQTHASETRREVADVRAQWGATPIGALKNIGALEGPLLAAHCVHLEAGDLEIMAQENDAGARNFRVSHNPTSNLKLASGVAPVEEFVGRGITTGLGTDGAASNNRLDMWQEMRLSALLHKATTGDATVVSARQALLMATRIGARCLNLEAEIGSLEMGKKADIAILDFDKPHLAPRHNVVSHLVYAAQSSDVDSVLVDGKILLRRGQLTQTDQSEVLRKAAQAAARLTNAANANS